MRIVTFVIFFVLSCNLFGQQNNFSLSTSDKFIIDSYTIKDTAFQHSTFKPILKSTIHNYNEIEHLIYHTGSDSAFIARKKHPWFWKKLLIESFVDIKKDKFSLRIDPLINVEYGKDTTRRMTTNSRGLVIYGDLNEKFSFITGVLETQTFPEKHVTKYIKTFGVAPGQARVKNFKETGYDYTYSFGNISYSPSSHFNFQLGHGKQFLGDGYRSLLLSDIPSYYPYFRITSTFKRIQYINLWTSFQEVKPYDNRTLVYQRKHGSFTYLSYLLTNKIELGIFEAIMFQSTDSNSNNILPLDVANPIIGIRTMQYGYRFKHNAMIGFTAKANLLKQISIYGQFVIDDINRKGENSDLHKRTGYQIGLKFLEPIKIKNLFILTEYNSIKPFTYSSTVPYQNYSAFNEPLAHPLGANFNELILIARYNYKDFFVQGKITYSSRISGTIPQGQNIFLYYPDSVYNSDSYKLNSNTEKITHLNLECGIFINQRNKLQLSLGTHAMMSSFGVPYPTFLYFAIKTPISNLYYDF